MENQIDNLISEETIKHFEDLKKLLDGIVSDLHTLESKYGIVVKTHVCENKTTEYPNKLIERMMNNIEANKS